MSISICILLFLILLAVTCWTVTFVSCLNSKKGATAVGPSHSAMEEREVGKVILSTLCIILQKLNWFKAEASDIFPLFVEVLLCYGVQCHCTACCVILVSHLFKCSLENYRKKQWFGMGTAVSQNPILSSAPRLGTEHGEKCGWW